MRGQCHGQRDIESAYVSPGTICRRCVHSVVLFNVCVIVFRLIHIESTSVRTAVEAFAALATDKAYAASAADLRFKLTPEILEVVELCVLSQNLA